MQRAGLAGPRKPECQLAAHQLHIASFIRSAAVPWMRVLTALRSASSRALPHTHAKGGCLRVLGYNDKALAGYLANLVPPISERLANSGAAERATRCPAPRPSREHW